MIYNNIITKVVEAFKTITSREPIKNGRLGNEDLRLRAFFLKHAVFSCAILLGYSCYVQLLAGSASSSLSVFVPRYFKGSSIIFLFW